ncbi:MAG: hypothetical protein HYU64_14365 [Armatimonadetes bacterium]|nr:hypothetical protein [Armatimonadota bacterium]
MKPLLLLLPIIALLFMATTLPCRGQEITRKYHWVYDNRTYDMDLQIPKGLYDYFKKKPRVEDYTIYVTDPQDDGLINFLISLFKKYARENKLNEYDLFNTMVAWVQSLPYTSDSVTTGFDEYPRYPVETLVDNGGDCEDTSILLASILKAMGYPTVLLAPTKHMAVGVAVRQEFVKNAPWPIHVTPFEMYQYAYLETTGDGWKIGMVPPQYKNDRFLVFSLVPRAAIKVLSVQSRIHPEGQIPVVDVTLENLGSSPSVVTVRLAFDAGPGKVPYATKDSKALAVPPGNRGTFTLSLPQPPTGVRTRLLIQILSDNRKVDEWASGWQNI